MSGFEIGAYLRDVAANVEAPHCIVEIGPWLGANTAQMGAGTVGQKRPATIHAYDMFQARSDEVRKAAAMGITIAKGEDTRPLVRKLIEPFGGTVELHKGDIMDITWDGTPIGLYVDDAAKTPTHFYNMIATFAPSFVPGMTTVVLMDYRFWEDRPTWRARKRFRVQQNLVERFPDSFEEIHNDVFDGTVMAAFRFVKAFPMGMINAQAKVRRALDLLPF
ncbi:class I SAM-dependent methyltransferase [Rhodobacteraceae bacterium N5(2021)]|uniref:Class I SAM-dependent methyltransferase n=1 Tax=Gymnodinialimonas phycosphaerae TaxID=2841589 RepID=A0A975YFD6_9RHOB|nr:class I SAM-dependent methyltransferase [Gymnodinialimonas phycosphaerae]MBY4894636.1 class I SAM-dependent methyltransferase [Gymnodinialimonas phycosphaerae]